MPWTARQHAFFALCAGPSRAKAVKKCPKPADAKRMMGEGIRKKVKR